ncbi:AMP-binding protein, partial [Bdellovibrionota bacterium FG-2]
MPFIVRKTVTDTFLERVKVTPDRVAFTYKPKDPELASKKGWKEVTFREFYGECRQVSLGLMGLGIKPGDRVAILSTTRFEWSLSDMAILGASGVTVPIYPSITADDVHYIINHCEARIIFVEDQKQLQKLLAKHEAKPDAFPYLEKIITYETGREALENTDRPQFPEVLTLQALKELGRREDEREPARFDRNLATSRPDDLISICYTSGTTGVPKGAMLTHDNMISVLEDCIAVMKGHIKEEGEVVLSFLPFSHIIGKVESIAIHTFGWKQAFAESMEKLLSNFAEVRPTLIFSVPRVFEKAYAQVMAIVDSASPARRSFFHWAMGMGRAYYEKVWKKERQSPGMLAQYQIAKRLVFDQIAKRFGGRLRFAICGGAPLPAEIGQFFQISGVQILEGYGLT